MERVTFSIKISDIVSIVESVTYEASKSAPDVRTASSISFDDSDDVQHGTLLASLGSAMAALCSSLKRLKADGSVKASSGSVELSFNVDTGTTVSGMLTTALRSYLVDSFISDHFGAKGLPTASLYAQNAGNYLASIVSMAFERTPNTIG